MLLENSRAVFSVFGQREKAIGLPTVVICMGNTVVDSRVGQIVRSVVNGLPLLRRFFEAVLCKR